MKKIYYTMDASGNAEMREFMDEMQKNGVECYEVLTRTVAYLMERVDLVLIGAEAVVESGSGNFQIMKKSSKLWLLSNGSDNCGCTCFYLMWHIN